jgi:hypothetical protein
MERMRKDFGTSVQERCKRLPTEKVMKKSHYRSRRICAEEGRGYVEVFGHEKEGWSPSTEATASLPFVAPSAQLGQDLRVFLGFSLMTLLAECYCASLAFV